MFMGEYNHTVDTKGRLIVPSKFRELLGDEFVVTKGLDGCLFVYSGDEWKLMETKFREVSQFSKEARKFARFSLQAQQPAKWTNRGVYCFRLTSGNLPELRKKLFWRA